MRVTYLSAPSNVEFPVCAQVIDKKIGQPEFVVESNEHIKSSGMDCDTMRLFGIIFTQLQIIVNVVPDPHRSVCSAGHNNGLSDTDI
jgi:hypothetical protein